jgi:hypothetical protein
MRQLGENRPWPEAGVSEASAYGFVIFSGRAS